MNNQYKKLYNEAANAYRTDPRSKSMTLIEFIMIFIDDHFIESEVG